MSEKSVGTDWKRRNIYTLRHAAGSKKYGSLKNNITPLNEKTPFLLYYSNIILNYYIKL